VRSLVANVLLGIAAPLLALILAVAVVLADAVLLSRPE
jgi:hypothetical protein